MSTITVDQRTGPKKLKHKKPIYAVALLVLTVLLVLGLSSMAMAAVTSLYSNSATGAAGASGVSVSYTAANTGDSRLMVVGVVWNSGNVAENEGIGTATYTPTGGAATALTLLRDYDYAYDYTSGGSTITVHRHAAILYAVNPTSGAGTVNITFQNAGGGAWDGGVDSGIVAGVAFFAGVDQSTPLGTYVEGAATSGSPSVLLTGLVGDELVFDTVLKGNTTVNLTGTGQTELWNALASPTRGAASYEQATTSSVTMSWGVGNSTGTWVSVAVPIKPAATNVAPQITSDGGGSTAAVDAAENQTAVTDVNATDANAGDTLTYSKSAGADQALFAIDGTTGVLTFITAPDYETPTDAGGNNVYDVTVQVSDGSLTDTQDIAVTVTNVNDVAPQITSDGAGPTAAVSAPENQTAVTDVNATDADSVTLTYSISGGADQAKFDIVSNTGVLTFITAPDFETPTDVGANNVYDVIVQVSDGSLNDTQAIAVTVTDAGENVAPVITSDGGGSLANVNAAENQTAVTNVDATDANAGDTLTYSIDLMGGDDGVFFNINPTTGVLTFKSAPDYESPTDAGGNNVYDVTVQVSDGSLTDDQFISVTVTNVNDVAPQITSNGAGPTAAVSAQENQTAVTDVNATDGDSATLTYSLIGGADQAKFSINATTGVLTFPSPPDFETPTDVGANNVYDVIVQVSDGSFTDTQAIAVTVTDVAENVAPVITSDGGGATASLSAAENQTAVTDVNATDGNAGDTLTYSLSGGADQAKFAINSSTGVLTFLSAPDFETPTDVGANNVYDVTVQVSDGALTDTQTISVTVTDVAEGGNVAPEITSNGGGATAAVNAAENQTAVTDVNATDANAGDTLTYSISGGADQAKFAINSSTGVLTFVTAPNRESPTDANGDDIYEVTVQVSDGALTDTQAISRHRHQRERRRPPDREQRRRGHGFGERAREHHYRDRRELRGS